MPDVDRDALRTAAENATPGPWQPHAGRGGIGVADDDAPPSWVAEPHLSRADAEFIAAADPPTVLALLDALAAAEAHAERAEGVIRGALVRLRASGERSVALSELENFLAAYRVEPTPDLTEQGRALASRRDDLIAHGADPAELAVPLAPVEPTLENLNPAGAGSSGEASGLNAEPWTDPQPWINSAGERFDSELTSTFELPRFYRPRIRAQYDAEEAGA